MKKRDDTFPARLREIRIDRFGEHGIPAMAEAMEIPARTWENVEGGVEISGWAVLQLIEISGVNPNWLLTGEGERYRARSEVSLRRSSS